MGICGAKEAGKSTDDGVVIQVPPTKKTITNASELNIGAAGLVFENKNKISKEYNILWPPLGNGAFGEVRKCVQRETGHIRAVKIIFKDQATEEEVRRILREVEILRKLVAAPHPGPPQYYKGARVLPGRAPSVHRDGALQRRRAVR